MLLAEDHPTNQKVVEIVLEPYGVDLTIVENGAEAVAAWAKSGCRARRSGKASRAVG